MSHQLSPDRLSDLPDHILHRITSLAKMPPRWPPYLRDSVYQSDAMEELDLDKELVLFCEILKTLQLENYWASQIDIAALNLSYFYLKQVPAPQRQLIEMLSCYPVSLLEL
ncbi:hypothetical protein SLEP1_g50622 [Rubroshorea leprosula]|uniref:Uncharacterized protein n=1 Tax=Rubroshorea leprosula TaxID=152421 RepID=A0AAV5M1I9_9ROSI|nr:hypothetical protein SLEP1_g50622 [Rubroshorea leprosula]